jgi:hypothetical protein
MQDFVSTIPLAAKIVTMRDRAVNADYRKSTKAKTFGWGRTLTKLHKCALAQLVSSGDACGAKSTATTATRMWQGAARQLRRKWATLDLVSLNVDLEVFTTALSTIVPPTWNSCVVDAIVVLCWWSGHLNLGFVETRERFAVTDAMIRVDQSLASTCELLKSCKLTLREVLNMNNQQGALFGFKSGGFLARISLVTDVHPGGRDHMVVYLADVKMLIDNDGDFVEVSDVTNNKAARQVFHGLFNAASRINLLQVWQMESL